MAAISALKARPRLLQALCQHTAAFSRRVSSSGTCENQENVSEKSIKEMEDVASQVIVSSIDPHRRPMKPLIKEMFCGRLDTIVLSYPDVLNNDRYFRTEDKVLKLRHSLRDKAELVADIDSSRRISKDILLAMRSQGMFGLRGEKESGGEDMSVTESLRLLEEVATANLSLSQTLINTSWYAVEVIDRFARDEVKKKYLPSLYSGSASCTLCVSDETAGVDADSCSVTAFYDSHDGQYVINGTKTWVTNASYADLLLVWANVMTKQMDTGTDAPCLHCFLVDAKNTPGITIHKDERYETRGLKGVELTSITFNNVTVPEENLVGERGEGFNVLVHSVADEGRLASATQILAALRKLITATVRHSLEREAFGVTLNQFDLVNQQLGECALKLYALESAIYMTAGLADFQTEPDISVESTACRLLAIQTARCVTNACRKILGKDTYLANEVHSSLVDDIEGLSWWESTEDLSAMFIGLTGMMYSGEVRQDAAKVQMNPFSDQLSFVQLKLLHRRAISGKAKLKIKIFESVHGSLGDAANSVEAMLARFDAAVEHFMGDYGHNAQTQEVKIAKLADVAVQLFATISALARANRSYCDGHRHADTEFRMCIAHERKVRTIVDQNIMDIVKPLGADEDYEARRTAKYMCDNGGYVFTHPLTKNMF